MSDDHTYNKINAEVRPMVWMGWQKGKAQSESNSSAVSATVSSEKYLALLTLSLEMAKELRTLCNDEIHRNQVDQIMALIFEVMPSPNR